MAAIIRLDQWLRNPDLAVSDCAPVVDILRQARIRRWE